MPTKNSKQMKKLFQEGGLNQQGGMVEEETGNEVPPGALKEEVRDDIPAQLSEGEFVFPADVVRFIGLERLMQLRQMAKEGLSKMDAMGQMGNADEATEEDDGEFETEIDDIMGEVEAESEGAAPVKKSEEGRLGFAEGGNVPPLKMVRYEKEGEKDIYVPTTAAGAQITVPEGYAPSEKQVSFGGVYRSPDQAQKTATEDIQGRQLVSQQKTPMEQFSSFMSKEGLSDKEIADEMTRLGLTAQQVSDFTGGRVSVGEVQRRYDAATGNIILADQPFPGIGERPSTGSETTTPPTEGTQTTDVANTTVTFDKLAPTVNIDPQDTTPLEPKVDFAGQYGYFNGAPVLNAQILDQQMAGSPYTKLNLPEQNDLGWATRSKYSGFALTGAALYGFNLTAPEVQEIAPLAVEFERLKRDGKIVTNEYTDPESGNKTTTTLVNTGRTDGEGNPVLIPVERMFTTMDNGEGESNGAENYKKYQASRAALDRAGEALGIANYKNMSVDELYARVNAQEKRVLVTGRVNYWDRANTDALENPVNDDQHAAVLYKKVGNQYLAISAPQFFNAPDPKARGVVASIARAGLEFLKIPPIRMALSAYTFGQSDVALNVGTQAASAFGYEVAAQGVTTVAANVITQQTATFVGNMILNTTTDGLFAAINGGNSADIFKAMAGGAIRTAAPHYLNEAVTKFLEKGGAGETIGNLIKSATNLKISEVANVFTKSLSSATAGLMYDKDFTTSFRNSLIINGLSTSAANRVASTLQGSLSPEAIDRLSRTAATLTKITTDAIANKQNPEEALRKYVQDNFPDLVRTGVTVGKAMAKGGLASKKQKAYNKPTVGKGLAAPV